MSGSWGAGLGGSCGAGVEELVAGELGEAAGPGHLLKNLGVRGSWRRGLWFELVCFTKVSFCEQHNGHFWGNKNILYISIGAVVMRVHTSVKKASNCILKICASICSL